MSTFPERLKAAREKAGLTTDQLRRRTNLGPGNIEKMESGERAMPIDRVLSRIADVVKVDAYYLRTGERLEQLKYWGHRSYE